MIPQTSSGQGGGIEIWIPHEIREACAAMAALNCELEGVSVVLVGSFNPSIFQPKWLGSKKIIREAEGEHANIQIISPEISSFTADWLTVQVTRDRFAASTTDAAQFEALRDCVVSVFTLLEHTPVTQMGLNRDMHYRMSSIEEWHAVGHTLAPKELWNQLMESPGLQTLVISGKRKGSAASKVMVTVQPSTRVQPGIYIGTNEHFEERGDSSTPMLVSLLKESWRPAQKYAKQVAEMILSNNRLSI
jgi:hypothetical protein